MKPALLAVVSLAALAAAASPPARAAGECVEASELSLNGVPLRTSRRDVLQRLGRPVGEWKERLDRHLDHLVYPGLDVRIREDGSVESLLARSDRYSLPSGVRVGLPWKEVWPKQGLTDDGDARPGIFVTIPLCGESYGTAFLQFGFGRDLRLVRIEIGVSPSADDAPSLAEEREEANGEPFPWSKGPLEYIAMLRKHRRRIHKVDDKAPAGWVKESDLPALVALLKDGRPCAGTQRTGEPEVFNQRSSVDREARFLIEAFREDEFPPGASSLLGVPTDAEVLAWWDEWRKSKPILPWPKNEAGLAVGSTYETDFRISAATHQWWPVAGFPLPGGRTGAVEWVNPKDLFLLLVEPTGTHDAGFIDSWPPVRVTFRVVSQETKASPGGGEPVLYRCRALRVSSWQQ
ncbi:MAG: hypothetical protein DMF53_03445 [Acidobacteria bacterium]|nr:MAG: hypothetical protein DMF53_03445 [Acidobacteriota bacterium]